MHPLLAQTSHRTIELPTKPWIMVQRWHDLLFAHWALPTEQVRKLIPKELELDLWDGQAYVGVIPFWMSGIRARFAPPIPGLSTTPELNVRIYVKYRGKPGVYFFSLDITKMAAVWGARTFYHLPYFHARMFAVVSGDKVNYSSERIHQPLPAEFRGSYGPVGDVRVRPHGSLESFLTDRYCLYTVTGGQVRRTYVHHLPWPLQDAEADIQLNTVAQAQGIELPATKPILHFSKFVEVLVWWPEVA